MSLLVEIKKFEGEHDFLSNFYAAPVMYDNAMYPTSEHAYQAAKTLYYDQRAAIQVARTPGVAKRLGQKVTMRPDWDEIKPWIMKEILHDKFTRHPDLMQRLIDTGDAYLEEGNHWKDVYWGVCEGKGRNVLGLLLMDLRKAFISLANK